MKYYYLFFLLLLVHIGCKSTPINTPENLTKEDSIPQFLDSVAATAFFKANWEDAYFTSLTPIDMHIQMKTEGPLQDRSKTFVQFSQYILEQVEDFEPGEIKYMEEVFTEVNRRLKALNSSLIIPDIKLVKTKLNHYGPDVYYTIGDAIFLPKNTLKRTDIKGQTNVMLHEVWHILSRYNPSIRSALYKLIGFKEHNRNVKIPDLLNQKLMINPDGFDFKFAIQLGDKALAVPVVYSKAAVYSKSKPGFFDYLGFDLFELSEDGTILVNDNGGTTLDPAFMPSFFAQIKDNTQYIIHPDEIIADNFMLAVNANDNRKFDDYSTEGKKLLTNIIALLQVYGK